MKFFILFLISSVSIFSSNLNIKSQKFAPVKVIVASIKKNSGKNLEAVSKAVIKDLNFSGQFDPKYIELEDVPTAVSDFKNFFKDGYGFSIFLSRAEDNKFKVRVYDNSEQKMILGKKVEAEGEVTGSFLGHKISDEIFPVLTGRKTSYSSLIAACKKVDLNSKKYCYHIYLFYPSEFDKKVKTVNFNTLNIAPRWSNKYPLLYYSQHTPLNVRLVSVNSWGNHKVITNFDGLNMTPAFSKEGSVVISLTENGHGVLCRYQFDKDRKKGLYKPLTGSKIHAVSPSFIDEENIVFCMIKQHKPRIAILDLKNNVITQITQTFSTSPVYSSVRDCIAYCAKVKGTSQVFIYDMKKKTHKQLTFDDYNKDECSWSPCGNFIMFSKESDTKSQVVSLNLINNTIVEITPEGEDWTYPAWSPSYSECFLFS